MKAAVDKRKSSGGSVPHWKTLARRQPAAPWYVYIVEGRGKLYTGITTDLERREDEHNNSPRGAKWCKANRPVTLVWWVGAKSRSEASQIEAKIKKLTRAEKLALIISGIPEQ